MTDVRRDVVAEREQDVQGWELAAVSAAVGAVLGVALNVPQVWTSCVHRQVAGLSPAARWLAVLQASTWLVYGLDVGSDVHVVTNLVCGAMHVGVLIALLALDPQARALGVRQGLAAAAWLGLVCAAAGTGAGVGALAAVCAVAALVPQLVHLHRARGSSTRGVSRTSTWLTVACNAAWAVHGLLLDAPAVWGPSLLGAAAALATLVLLAPARPARRPVRLGLPVAADELALAA